MMIKGYRSERGPRARPRWEEKEEEESLFILGLRRRKVYSKLTQSTESWTPECDRHARKEEDRGETEVGQRRLVAQEEGGVLKEEARAHDLGFEHLKQPCSGLLFCVRVYIMFPAEKQQPKRSSSTRMVS